MIMFGIAGAILLFQLRILTGPSVIQVCYIPDDGYYYLTIARNFFRYGYWTFDGGKTVTTGFHLLWAWILAIVYGLSHPSIDLFVRYSIFSGIIIFWIAAFLLYMKAPKQGRVRWQQKLAAVLLFSSPYALLGSTSCTEWPCAVLAAILYWGEARKRPVAWRGSLKLFVLGAIGSLVRSDFGVFPLAWVIVLLLARWKGRRTQPIVPIIAGLAGSIAGVFVMFLHNKLYTGMALQCSALVKHTWAIRRGLTIQGLKDPIDLVLSLFPGLLPGVTTKIYQILILPLIAIFIWLLKGKMLLLKRWFRRRKTLEPDAIALFAAALTTALYIAIYTRTTELQFWYTSNLFLPVLLLATMLFKLLKNQKRKIIIGAGLLISINIILLNVPSPRTTPFPWQRQFLYKANVIRSEKNEVWGGWNSGIMGYYSDSGLINLDGLMNNEIYPLIKSGHVSMYFKMHRIKHVGGFAKELNSSNGLYLYGLSDASPKLISELRSGTLQ